MSTVSAFSYDYEESREEKNRQLSLNILELLEIAAKYGILELIKVNDDRHEIIMKYMPEEYVARFLELAPQPETAHVEGSATNE